MFFGELQRCSNAVGTPHKRRRWLPEVFKGATSCVDIPIDGSRRSAGCRLHQLQTLEVVEGDDTRVVDGFWSIEGFELVRFGRLDGVAEVRDRVLGGLIDMSGLVRSGGRVQQPGEKRWRSLGRDAPAFGKLKL